MPLIIDCHRERSFPGAEFAVRAELPDPREFACGIDLPDEGIVGIAAGQGVLAGWAAGFWGRRGAFALAWDLEMTTDALPLIVQQPQSLTGIPGSQQTFQVVANGTGLRYQWHIDGRPIIGATNATLAINNAQTENIGFYRVAITNSAGRGVVSVSAALELGSESGPVTQDKVEDLFGATVEPLIVAAGLSANISSPYMVGAGGLGWHAFSNVEGATEEGEVHCRQIIRGSRWMYLLATNNGTMVVDAQLSAIPTVVAVYRETPDGGRELSPRDCAVNSRILGYGVQRAYFEAVRGTLYYIGADGWNQTKGVIRLDWALGRKPQVLNNYTNLLVSHGSRLHLEAQVPEAFPPPSFQWWLNGQPIAGATNALLETEVLNESQTGLYSVVVSNAIAADVATIAGVTLERPQISIFGNHFTSGIEGWTQSLAGLQFNFNATNGNPGGCLVLSGTTTNRTFYWGLPPQYVTNLQSAYGGWLVFDLKDARDVDLDRDIPLVEVITGNTKLQYIELYPVRWPSASWQTYYVPLRGDDAGAEGIWVVSGGAGRPATRDEMIAAFRSAQGVRIRGRAAPGVNAALDNVALVVSQPFLVVVQTSNGKLLLTWPTVSPAFQLQSTDNLTQPNWTTNFPRVLGTTNEYDWAEIQPSAQTQFFRLELAPR